MFSSLLGLLPFLASAQAYFILSHPILETTRLDPIVQPGGVSGHVHSIVGGSNFDKVMTYESARASGCTTAPVSEDKSNYWTPQLYYYNPVDQSYQAIPAAGVNTYYLPRGGKDGKVQAFPDGLRMVSGSPFRRTFNNDADSKAITFVCLDYAGGHQGDPEWAERNSFFNHNCPNGMRAQVFFRSCWNGVDLDSPDHLSHMAWPSGGVDGGECPASHPVRLVSLFYEFIYNVQQFPFNDPQYPTWVLANGDTTGYGFHGDFLNGWPSYNNGTNILQQAIDGCNDNDGVGGELNNCPPFVPYLNGGSCGPQNLLVDEDVGFGHSIPKLPGDNPIWIGNGTKPGYANYTETSNNFTDFKSVIPSGYTETGCIAEGTSGRALTALYWSSPNMTRGACVSYCQQNGFPLAGVEYGQECRCDTAIRNGGSNTTLLDQSMCNFKCVGNKNEFCGGSSTMNLYNNPSMYPIKTYPTGWSYAGCQTEATSGRALTGYSFASSSMTQELCINTCASKGFKYAGAEYSKECYCGNTFNAGSAPTDDSRCSYACAGDDKAACGGSSVLSIFSFANTTVAVPATTNSTVAASSTATKNVTSSSAPIVNSTVAAATLTKSSAAVNSTSSAITSTSVVSSATANATITNATVASTTLNSTTTVVSTSSVVSPKPAVSSAATSTIATSSNATVTASLTPANNAVKVASASKSSATSSSAASSSTSKAASSSKVASSSVASSSTVSTSTTSSVSSAAASPSPSVGAAPAGWAVNGCMTEGSGGRALAAYSFTSDSMTYELCTSACSARGYKYAGIEYSRECYCADGFGFNAASAADSSCNMKCSGNANAICGGPSRLTTFVSTTPKVGPTLPNNWNYTGCFAEIPGGRALKTSNYGSSSMTIEGCIKTAISKGFAYAGLEYGQECWMAASLNSAAVQLDDYKCSMSCSGNMASRCGAGSILSVYNLIGGASPAAVVPSSTSVAASSSSTSVAPSPSPSTSTAAASTTTTTTTTTKVAGRRRSRR